MKKTALFVLMLLFLIWFVPLIAQQPVTAKKQPYCLVSSNKEVRIDQLISGNSGCPGISDRVPWTVFCNRGSDFGQKFYVADERIHDFLIYSGSGTAGRRIINPVSKGWCPKSNYLFHFSAEFSRNALIHRKCVLLNSPRLIDSICRGLTKESAVPVFSSPTDTVPREYLSLYSIYFIYQREHGRYLLGRDYGMPDLPPGSEQDDNLINRNINAFYNSQIIGWVDARRVFNYDNRLCFEPNFDNIAVRKRRCDNEYGNSKIFNSPGALEVFIQHEARVVPLWEEPDYFYFFPSYKNGIISGRLDHDSVQELLFCGSSGNRAGLKRLTNQPIEQRFFRFPFLGTTRDRDVFQLATTGKYIRSREAICDSLKRHKCHFKFFFIIPDSIPNYLSVFFLLKLDTVLTQTNKNYPDFIKRYNAVYYPSQFNQEFSNAAYNNDKAFPAMCSAFKNHVPLAAGRTSDDCFSTLGRVMDQENFNGKESNFVVLINNSRKTYLFNDKIRSIAGKLSDKNCFIMAFDLVSNPTFKAMIDSIMAAANLLKSRNENAPFIPDKWERIGALGNSTVLVNRLLALNCSVDTSFMRGPQILDFLEASYTPIASNLIRNLDLICNSRNDTIALTPSETAFRESWESIIPGSCQNNINVMRIMQMGYTRMKYRPSANTTDDIWKAEVLMTGDELRTMTEIIGTFTDNHSGNTCELILQLWETLIKRFIGEDIITDRSYKEKTIDMLLEDMIGARFGYEASLPIYNYTLGKIEQCPDELFVSRNNRMSPAEEYLASLATRNQELQDILDSTPFFLVRENGRSTGIKYYFVPVIWLP